MINFLNDCWFLFTTVLYWSSVAFVVVFSAFFVLGIVVVVLGTIAEWDLKRRGLNEEEGDEDAN